MNERISIKHEMYVLLNAMYELGKADGIREERLENDETKEDTYTRGYDVGHNAGYKEAMRDFRVPDL